MATDKSAWRLLNVRLIHDGAQPGAPLAEPLRFGLQASDGEVHSGVAAPDNSLRFDFTLEVKGDAEKGPPTFRGAFAHGPAGGRFIYLSWKRQGEHEHPWGWRIKIPLSGLGWNEIQEALRPGKCLLANVTGSRPHATQAIDWKVAPL